MVSASSWSLIEGSEIFFTITECPLTAVATFLALISWSVNSFEIALDTVPESTIMESTTISGASGSRPRCATSISRPFRFNSTALMLEEPTSRPTIVFDPNPNMCPPSWCGAGALARGLVCLALSGSLHRCLRFPLHFRLVRLLFHPLVQLRFLEAPAVPQFEGRNLLLIHVLVERVRTDSQVLRSLANVHHFSRVGHRVHVPSTNQRPAVPASPVPRANLGRKSLVHNRLRADFDAVSIAQPGETRSLARFPCFAGFYTCFLENYFRVVAHLSCILCYVLWCLPFLVPVIRQTPSYGNSHNQSTSD